MSSILFAKHVSFEHSVSSPRPVITSRREEKNNKAKVFQHPIDSHSQSASSCLISPHFAAGAVGVGRGAASFLATESTGTVLLPRLMTRIAGHARGQTGLLWKEDDCQLPPSKAKALEPPLLPGKGRWTGFQISPINTQQKSTST